MFFDLVAKTLVLASYKTEAQNFVSGDASPVGLDAALW